MSKSRLVWRRFGLRCGGAVLLVAGMALASLAHAGPLAPDLSLVGFTLLGQAAAGTAIVALVARVPLDRPLLATIGLLTVFAALVSLLHLGAASQAWRAPLHAGSSMLSREIAALGLFGCAWLLALFAPAAGHIALAVSGAALVYSMAEVYRIDAVPGWSTWRTHASFALSAALLGLIGVVWTSAHPPRVWWIAVAALVTHQFISRWRFYGRRAAKIM